MLSWRRVKSLSASISEKCRHVKCLFGMLSGFKHKAAAMCGFKRVNTIDGMREPKVCTPTPLCINWKIDTLVCARRISSTKVAGSLRARLYGRINRNGDFLPWLMGSLAVQMCLPALSRWNQSVCKWRWAAIRRFYPEDCLLHYQFLSHCFPFSLGCILSAPHFFSLSLHLTCALLGSTLLSPALPAPSRSSSPAFHVSFSIERLSLVCVVATTSYIYSVSEQPTAAPISSL